MQGQEKVNIGQLQMHNYPDCKHFMTDRYGNFIPDPNPDTGGAGNSSGLQNGQKIQLSPNTPVRLSLEYNTALFAVRVPSDCLLKIGSSANADDFGEMDSKGVIQTGFIEGDVWFTANKTVEVTPIVYKF